MDTPIEEVIEEVINKEFEESCELIDSYVDKDFDKEDPDDESTLDMLAESGRIEAPRRENSFMDKILPQDIGAEMGLLGALINNPKLLDVAINEGIRKDAFYRDAHLRIWSAITSLRESTDVINLASNLREHRLLSDVGGRNYLEELKKAGENVSGTKLKGYCENILLNRKRREIIRLGTIITEKAFAIEDKSSLEKFLREGILSLVTYVGEACSIYSHKEEVQNLVQNVEDRLKQNKRFELSTGYPSIDEITYGLRPGWLWILGARPSIGKTSFILNLMDNVAKQDKSALLFSYDSTRDEILTRMLSKYANINSEKFFDIAKLKENDIKKIRKASEELYKRNIIIDDRSPSLDKVIERVNRERKFANPSLIIIDHLQAFSSVEYKSRTESLGNVLRECKQIAKDTRATVLVISHLTRDVEKRKDKKPYKLTDYKDCGDVEQEVDIATMLYRPEAYWDDKKYRGWMSFIALKNRYGKVPKTARLNFDKKTGNITEYKTIPRQSSSP
jgi:replicative DNA helicase